MIFRNDFTNVHLIVVRSDAFFYNQTNQTQSPREEEVVIIKATVYIYIDFI